MENVNSTSIRLSISIDSNFDLPILLFFSFFFVFSKSPVRGSNACPRPPNRPCGWRMLFNVNVTSALKRSDNSSDYPLWKLGQGSVGKSIRKRFSSSKWKCLRWCKTLRDKKNIYKKAQKKKLPLIGQYKTCANFRGKPLFQSPQYERSGWLDVNNQVTYLPFYKAAKPQLSDDQWKEI